MVITKQPYLKCCGNCKHFVEGYDGWHKCYINYTPAMHGNAGVDATDICEKYEQEKRGKITW
jgi:hypothetical protein